MPKMELILNRLVTKLFYSKLIINNTYYNEKKTDAFKSIKQIKNTILFYKFFSFNNLFFITY